MFKFSSNTKVTYPESVKWSRITKEELTAAKDMEEDVVTSTEEESIEGSSEEDPLNSTSNATTVPPSSPLDPPPAMHKSLQDPLLQK